ncbi:nucleotide sugar dehydrogenase (plasmid) [Halorientalis pallida]|uniref:nucleotide sugar dehydrogenase n=1 Tax=Halorientalis pallida TaxID=2479928 RepID=UPI003C6F3190
MRQQSESSVSLYGGSSTAVGRATAIRAGRVPVAVYGLGKMGLPLATVFAEATGNTVGVDVDPAVVESVSDGDCPVTGEPGLPGAIRRVVAEGSLVATTEGDAAADGATVHVIIVPTLVEAGSPELTALRAAVSAVASGLDPGDLVCIESTVPPGTCEGVVVPQLVEESDCERGEFGVAFCPERTASGRALRDVRGAYPKVVGGVDTESTRAAASLYDVVTDNEVHTVADATTAECVKVFEGVYRDVNIALANELATLAEELGVDVYEAIETANAQPYCDLHRPGAGVGGHCIPYYPYFLIDTCDTGTPLLRRARRINDAMPGYTVGKLSEGLRERGVALSEATVAVLGFAYRPGVDETRESPGVAIASLLRDAGADVVGVDPVVDLDTIDVRPATMEALPDFDLDGLVLATAHDEFDDIDWNQFERAVVVDGRNALDESVGPGRTVRVVGKGEDDRFR